MFIADRLKLARTICEYTQQQVADILGIDRSAYTYYESGRILPPSDILNRVAALFKIDSNWFTGETSDMNILSESDDIFTIKKVIKESGLLELSDDEKEIVGLFRMLQGTTDKNRLAEMLRKFASEYESENNEKEQ